ncbi:sensor histidine kinase [Methylomonas koyamae]|uniref:sensor histidine kinase n=1 Tax=Methylomonas koyamae TaxID=702114 RepID=UPI00278BC98D|nr:ATP-binding protein [Methylomonas koyamae]
MKATLEEMVNHWSERNAGLQLNIRCSDAVDGLDKNLTVQIFRVIQECLTNVVRHAGAQRVVIDLDRAEAPAACLHLRVQDDGQGCDLQAVKRGFGLLGIKERIKSLDGELKVISSPGAGMVVDARIPL